MKFPRLDIERERNAISTELDIKKQIVFSKTIKKLQNRDILLIEVKSAEQGKKLLVTGPNRKKKSLFIIFSTFRIHGLLKLPGRPRNFYDKLAKG